MTRTELRGRERRDARHRLRAGLLAAASALALAGCASGRLAPFTTDGPPLVLTDVRQAGGQDRRARFREIYCAVLAAQPSLPDHRPCESALTRVGSEASASGVPVNLGPSRRGLVGYVVAGIGWECLEGWLPPTASVAEHLGAHGYGLVTARVDGLSGSARNARRIRDEIMAMPAEPGPPRLVLIGYSKGLPDLLEAVVAYPEIHPRVAAVVSLAGAVGGSPLANAFAQWHVELFRYFPRADCTAGDGAGLESLRPGVRRAWLAAHRLPPALRYYSVVAYPRPEHVSLALRWSYGQLARIDARNDGQMLFYDQVVPGSALLGYLDADHWAVAVPIARTHPRLASLFVTHNEYPREALAEAILRYVEEDLDQTSR